jgi:hypothetical protein
MHHLDMGRAKEVFLATMKFTKLISSEFLPFLPRAYFLNGNVYSNERA